MMVPQIARSVFEQVCTVHPEIDHAGDPFSGSGTIMTESMQRGLSFTGTDINPMAILICKVKKGPFFVKSLSNKIDNLIDNIDCDKRWAIEVHFPNRDKWFTRDVLIALSKIRRNIRKDNSLWARRFFWVTLAEAVRATSNSRTSTYKLHTRTAEEILNRQNDPISIFKKAIYKNLDVYMQNASKLKKSGQLKRGRYTKTIDISLADTRNTTSLNLCDIIITSPPYGDNATTVPYGQYSYLPLQWIDLEDIDIHIDMNCLRTTHEIDTRSLGGSKVVIESDKDSLCDRSKMFTDYIWQLKDLPRDRELRVTAFFRDLDSCLDPILQSLRDGGLMVWTLGNRKVGGIQVPFDLILEELLVSRNTRIIHKIVRQISSKKMAPKNNISETMSSETILVMRKAI